MITSYRIHWPVPRTVWKSPYLCIPYVGNAQLFFYNPKMFAEVGYEKPMTTWANVLEGATKVSEQGAGRKFGRHARGSGASE